VDIVEPTKLRAEEVGTLWRYWRDSQRTNERPIYFIEALPKDVRRHEDGVMWPKGKSKSKVSSKKDKGKGRGKGKGKEKYVEPDDSSETSSDEEFEGLFGGSSEDDDDDDEENDGDEGNAGREVAKWGPPSGMQKNRPQVHIVTQIGQPGGSGLSDAAKQGLGKSSAKPRAGEVAKVKKGKKGKKNVMEPIIEHEEDGPADVEMQDVDDSAEVHPGSPAACESDPEYRYSYLQKLSTNVEYRELLDMMDKEKVRLCCVSLLIKYYQYIIII
jgi:hypothetical protein